MTRRACISWAVWLTVGVVLAPSLAGPTDDDRLLAGAAPRIEKHRKADGQIRVLDAHGQPVAGARVEVRQTRHAFLFGCNIFGWGNMGPPADEQAYRQQFARLFDYATLGVYWGAYEPRRGEPGHAHAEAVSRWCREQGIVVKGHPLVWNNADPRWLPDDLGEVRRLQMARIDDCVRRFAGLIDRWDVVNEIVAYDREGFVRTAPKLSAVWKRDGQIEFAQACFAAARRAGPQATLLVNDYRNDPPYERVIEKLVDAQGQRLYDVIGLQSHMHSDVWELKKVWEICERFARFGVPLHFTELTIISGEKRSWKREVESHWPSTPADEAAQAHAVERLYRLLFSHPAVQAVTWWDFADRHAWRNAPAGLLRKDLTPKPAYDALVRLVKRDWWTNTSVSTDAQGQASLRGFLGDYEATLVVGQKRQTLGGLALRRDADNRWELRLSSP